jgi:hypothetical protein
LLVRLFSPEQAVSEYQYYEFRAVDRPLSGAETKKLRDLSSRAEITPVSFTNHYEWGDFKGDPRKLMWQYFDAFLYLANWGTRRLMFRLPADLLDAGAARPYCCDDGLSLEVKGDHALLEWQSDDEGGDWDHDGVGLLEEILPLRETIVGGDLRPLYVGWLSAVDEGLIDDDAPEPPVPPGLKARPPALNALARFLRVSDDLLAVAAERSDDAPARAAPSREAMEAKVAALPERQRNAVLLELLEGDPAAARRALLRTLRDADPKDPAPAAAKTGRTAGDLIAAAEAVAEARRQMEAERLAKKKARLAAEAAEKRAKYLDELSGRQEQTWELLERKVESKQQAEYDEAVGLLKDLRDISLRDGAARSFEARVRSLHARHVKKSTFVKRLQKAGLLKWGGVA